MEARDLPFSRVAAAGLVGPPPRSVNGRLEIRWCSGLVCCSCSMAKLPASTCCCGAHGGRSSAAAGEHTRWLPACPCGGGGGGGDRGSWCRRCWGRASHCVQMATAACGKRAVLTGSPSAVAARDATCHPWCCDVIGQLVRRPKPGRGPERSPRCALPPAPRASGASARGRTTARTYGGLSFLGRLCLLPLSRVCRRAPSEQPFVAPTPRCMRALKVNERDTGGPDALSPRACGPRFCGIIRALTQGTPVPGPVRNIRMRVRRSTPSSPRAFHRIKHLLFPRAPLLPRRAGSTRLVRRPSSCCERCASPPPHRAAAPVQPPAAARCLRGAARPALRTRVERDFCRPG